MKHYPALIFLIGIFIGCLIQIITEPKIIQPTSPKVVLCERIYAIPQKDSLMLLNLFKELQIREGFVDSLYKHLDSYRKPHSDKVYYKWHYYAFYGHMIDSLFYINYHKTWRCTKHIADSVLTKDINDRYWQCRGEDQGTYQRRIYNLFCSGNEY